jgi:hypothetical protein
MRPAEGLTRDGKFFLVQLLLVLGVVLICDLAVDSSSKEPVPSRSAAAGEGRR